MRWDVIEYNKPTVSYWIGRDRASLMRVDWEHQLAPLRRYKIKEILASTRREERVGEAGKPEGSNNRVPTYS